ncbi:MAG: hypothetical protein Dbin4_02992 [Alphaproteobacteria bacterium]|nr:hypothetical protein [Alphaproteobacteria bacterium]
MTRMKIIHNWRTIVKRAWSIRLMLLGAISSGAEAALPFFAEEFPRGIFAALSFTVVAAAFAARLIAQESMDDD